MRKIWKNRSGTTLVELIVSAALLGIFCVCCGALVHPAAEVFVRLQRQLRAQQIADTIVEALRSELLYAEGTIRFADAATDAADWTKPFVKPDAYPQSGTALEIKTGGGYYELLDAGYVPHTVKVKADGSGETLVSPEKAAATPGCLHMRCFMGKGYVYEQGGGAQAAAYADAYTEKFYMQNKITMDFSVQGYRPDTGSGANRITAVKVTVRVYGPGTDPAAAPLYTQSAILELPNEPMLVQTDSRFAPKTP